MYLLIPGLVCCAVPDDAYLHPTMYLLIRNKLPPCKSILQNLHPTMYLLIQIMNMI